MRESGSTDVDPARTVRQRVSSLGRYDALLAVIPIAFCCSILVGEAIGLPLEAALLGGGTVGVLALFDGLFLRPPTGLRRT
ncbi:hypothetical protein [Halosolutus gelatinilyticus]|uniref:hypothetical protein n=1 Tax=Halosolutus gelatinilyticus TaxID=2931975 RepID=UPI001FF540B8|nr:hypothetical protein [Halosolutus gelatinilyticus]